MTAAVRIEEHPRHVEIRLGARPGDTNPLDAALVGALHSALDRAEARPDCRALVISSAAGVFCSGLDLHADHRDRWFCRPAHSPWALFERLGTCPVVTMALLDGPATGGGVALASACDVVLAGTHASWRCTELPLGLVPAVALPFVARRTGAHRACLMALTAAEIDVHRGAEWGLADEVAPHAADLLPARLRELRHCRPQALRALKSYRSTAFPWPRGLAEEAAAVLTARLESPEVRKLLQSLREGARDAEA